METHDEAPRGQRVIYDVGGTGLVCLYALKRVGTAYLSYYEATPFDVWDEAGADTRLEIERWPRRDEALHHLIQRGADPKRFVIWPGPRP